MLPAKRVHWIIVPVYVIHVWSIFEHDWLITGSLMMWRALWLSLVCVHVWVSMCMCVFAQLQLNRGDNLSLPTVPGCSCGVRCGTLLSHILPRGRWSEVTRYISSLSLLQSTQAQHIYYCLDVATKSAGYNPDPSFPVCRLSSHVLHTEAITLALFGLQR